MRDGKVLNTPDAPLAQLGTEPLPTGAEALDEPFRAFPSWFMRVTCDRCGAHATGRPADPRPHRQDTPRQLRRSAGNGGAALRHRGRRIQLAGAAHHGNRGLNSLAHMGAEQRRKEPATNGGDGELPVVNVSHTFGIQNGGSLCAERLLLPFFSLRCLLQPWPCLQLF